MDRINNQMNLVLVTSPAFKITKVTFVTFGNLVWVAGPPIFLLPILSSSPPTHFSPNSTLVYS